MANSAYEYVKKYEREVPLLPDTWIVVRIDGRGFQKFADTHGFEKPNDANALNLMNECAKVVVKENTDIVFAYGKRDEFIFVIHKKSELFGRRPYKLVSVIVSLFSSTYVMKWNEHFPEKKLLYSPCFDGRLMEYPNDDQLRQYLCWSQDDCHNKNLYNTCYWKLRKIGGLSESEAQNELKGSEELKRRCNEILFTRFGINYSKLPVIFRKGSSVFRKQIEGSSKRELVVEYCDIVNHEFWEDVFHQRKSSIAWKCSNNTSKRNFEKFEWKGNNNTSKNKVEKFEWKGNNTSKENVKKFEREVPLLPGTWIVVRIDGRGFHKFADTHNFEKPNDRNALNLMNECAKVVLTENTDIVFAYGQSDEFSFVIHKKSELFGRRPYKLVSVIVSLFSSTYVMKWNEHFQEKKLLYPPCFDGRAIEYPEDVIRDYLAWRHADCHINNLYNTCYWNLRKEGLSRNETCKLLKGTSKEKNDLLNSRFGINYSRLPEMFRNGSSVFRKQKLWSIKGELAMEYCDIINNEFWEKHPYIFQERKSARSLSGLAKLSLFCLVPAVLSCLLHIKCNYCCSA